MELAEKLKASGWHLTDDGIKTLTTSANGDITDPRKIIDEALNRDLRDIGGGALSTKRDDSTGMLIGRIVLQVQRVRNIAAPKSNEESKAAPRLLLLDLSDGQTSLQALELEPVPALNLNVAPGTKIFFKAEKLQMMHGFLLLRPNELQILGGRVDALYEKWEFARTMLKYARSGRPQTGSSAPPPWVAFGKSVDDNGVSRNFKSLASLSDKDKPSKENDEFNTMRSEAIAVASKSAVKKVFGGGGQNIVDHNIKKILDKGYTKEEAETALQATRNNLERALYNLKRRKDAALGNSEPPMRGGRFERSGREGGKRGASLKDEAEAAKPAANATLFDFLTSKLPGTEPPATADSSKPTHKPSTAEKPEKLVKRYETDYKVSAVPEAKLSSIGEHSRFENNVSSSFAANRGAPAGRMSRGGGARNRGGREERPPRGGGGSFHQSQPERSMAAASSMKQDSRKPENSRAAEQTYGKSNIRNGQDHAASGKGNTAEKHAVHEQESSLTKDQGNNRRNPDRRNGNSRPENGNPSNRRRQQANVGSTGAPPARSATNTQSTNNNDDVNTRLNKVVEETSKLKLNSSKRDNRRSGKPSAGGVHYSNRHQSDTQATTSQSEKPSTDKPNPQPTQRQQAVNPGYTQLPNGYTYDPSKIMGFQSKEANEFAMSLLKSQGLSLNQAAASPSPSTIQPSVPSPPAIKPINNNNNNLNSQTASKAVNPQPVTVQQPPPQDFGPNAWLWKSGDLCMAKYWDDGRYYEAEITAVSDNTCVVFFLGYGNHEEVLKSDILPITDSQNRPLSNMSQGGHQHQRYRQAPQQQQVYVPPHKREY